MNLLLFLFLPTISSMRKSEYSFSLLDADVACRKRKNNRLFANFFLILSQMRKRKEKSLQRVRAPSLVTHLCWRYASLQQRYFFPFLWLRLCAHNPFIDVSAYSFLLPFFFPRTLVVQVVSVVKQQQHRRYCVFVGQRYLVFFSSSSSSLFR